MKGYEDAWVNWLIGYELIADARLEGGVSHVNEKSCEYYRAESIECLSARQQLFHIKSILRHERNLVSINPANLFER